MKLGKTSARARSIKEEAKAPPSGVTPPKTSPKPPPGPKPSTDGKPAERCRAFHGGAGCKRGAQCPDAHEWSATPKAERTKLCMLCGAPGHSKDQCSAPSAPKSPKRGEGPKAEAKPPAPPAPPSGSAASAKASPGFTAKQLEGILEGAQAALNRSEFYQEEDIPMRRSSYLRSDLCGCGG